MSFRSTYRGGDRRSWNSRRDVREIFPRSLAERLGRYLKCGPCESSWTHVPGSDVRADWAGCSSWGPVSRVSDSCAIRSVAERRRSGQLGAMYHTQGSFRSPEEDSTGPAARTYLGRQRRRIPRYLLTRESELDETPAGTQNRKKGRRWTWLWIHAQGDLQSLEMINIPAQESNART